MYITLKKILDVEDIEIKVVAGLEGINRYIKSINIMDNPDSLKWLTRDELILTTGYFIANDEELVKGLVKELNKLGCSGLAIKTGRYIEEIPVEIIRQGEELNFPIIELPYNHSLSTISSYIYKEIFKEQEKLDFLEDLLEARVNSMEEIKRLESMHGLDSSKPYNIALVRCVYNKKNSKGQVLQLDRIKQISSMIEDMGLELNKHIVTTIKNHEIVCFLQSSKEGPVIKDKNQLKEMMKKVHNRIKKIGLMEGLYIGIGEEVVNIINVQEAYNKAKESINKGIYLAREGEVFHYGDFMVYNMLEKEIDHSLLEKFCKNTIGPILDYDKKNNSAMLLTLEEYFNNNCNITETSNRLYIHRNTLVYRLEKIRDILSMDLKNPEENLELQIAIRIEKILNRDLQGL